MEIKILQYPDSLDDPMSIREQVFHQEQHIDRTIDFDGLDEESIHFVAYDHGKPIGTARLRIMEEDSLGKIERLAVLSTYRGKGIARLIMGEIERYLRNHHIPVAMLHAQSYVRSLYQKLGFQIEGGEFEVAGIAHVTMLKPLS